LKDRIERIIKLCESAEKGLNPFEIEIEKLFDILESYLPYLKSIDDLILDAESIRKLASVIYLQKDFLKEDLKKFILPELIKAKILLIGKEEMVKIFLNAWNPILSLEFLTEKRLEDAIKYFKNKKIESFGEREFKIKIMNFTDFLKSRIFPLFFSKESFERMKKEIYNELKDKGKISYWKFVKGKDFKETYLRAYILSHLITEGLAIIEEKPLEGKIFIMAEKAKGEKQSIAISLGKWK